MDWIKDFQDRFAKPEHKHLHDLKVKKFYGSLEINFKGGYPQNCFYKRGSQAVVINLGEGNLTETRGGVT